MWIVALWGCAGAPPIDSAIPEIRAPCDRDLQVTWDNWAGGFVRTQCQGCHAATAPDRYGAPTTITFDSEAAAIALAEAIRRSVIDDRTMPPAGGITDDELYLLEQWLVCFAE